MSSGFKYSAGKNTFGNLNDQSNVSINFVSHFIEKINNF